MVETDERYRLHRRFDRIGRLCGDDNMRRLFDAHVVVIGLGGVGSFAVEALARSGIGRLTLVDFDLVCVTNANRQLQALRNNIGKPKATMLAERVRLINPQIEARAVPLFYDGRVADAILGGGSFGAPTYVVDAIDNLTAKCHLLATCREKGIPVVCSTGAGGRWDPTAIAVADLSETTVDPLAYAARKILRRKHDFPREGPFGIPAVFSREPVREPIDLHYDHGEGFACVCPANDNDMHSCEDRNVIYGTAGFVTGAFGLACASVVVRAIAGPAQ